MANTGHAHIYSLWGRQQSCLSPQGQGSKLECTLFSNQTLRTNILPSDLDGRERDVFCGLCACGPSVKGIVGRQFGFGRVGVFASGRNSLAALGTVFFFSVPLIVSLPVTFSPLLQASCCFSSSSCVQHIFMDSEWRAVGKPRAKCQGQMHICA